LSAFSEISTPGQVSSLLNGESPTEQPELNLELPNENISHNVILGLREILNSDYELSPRDEKNLLLCVLERV